MQPKFLVEKGMKNYILLILCLCINVLYADTIRLHNESSDDIYVAVYYINGEAQRWGKVHAFPADSTIKIERPKAKRLPVAKWNQRYYDRRVAIAEDPLALKPELSRYEFARLSSKGIGSTYGNSFYITRSGTRFVGYDKTLWYTYRPLIKASNKLVDQTINLALKSHKILSPLDAKIREELRNTLSAIVNNPYKGVVATVRKGNTLSAGEQSYVAKRMPVIHRSIEKMIGEKVAQKDIPKIGIIASGGGYRAMIGTLGFLLGADDIGLLESLLYVVGLSGSTWCLSTWLSSGLSIQSFAIQLMENLDEVKNITNISSPKLMADALLVKYAYNQPLTLVDIYGALLANSLLRNYKDKRHQVYMSDQINIIQNGQFPMPIYTAVSADKGQKQYKWYEFSPYEVGASWLLTSYDGAYIPTWSFGRRFKNGLSQDFAPPQSLAFLQGVFGSAFAFTFNKAYEEIAGSLQTRTGKILMNNLIKIAGKRMITNAQVNNFTYAMPESVKKELKELRMADAGMAFNLPYPPLSGERSARSMDILIFLDISAGVDGAPELRGVEKYARTHKLKFPVIDYTDISKKAISIFKDDKDPEVPIVIYMPRIRDQVLWEKEHNNPAVAKYEQQIETFDPERCSAEGFCGTTNFAYTIKQVQKLSYQMAFNMVTSKDMIIDAITFKISQKAGIA